MTEQDQKVEEAGRAPGGECSEEEPQTTGEDVPEGVRGEGWLD